MAVCTVAANSRFGLYLRGVPPAVDQFLHSQIHGIPTVGVLVLVLVGLAVVKALFSMGRNLILIGVCLVGVVVFAPQLLGKQKGAELQKQVRDRGANCASAISSTKTSSGQALDRCTAAAQKAAKAVVVKRAKTQAKHRAQAKARAAAKH
jgi:hypothetical protein